MCALGDALCVHVTLGGAVQVNFNSWHELQAIPPLLYSRLYDSIAVYCNGNLYPSRSHLGVD